MADNLTTPDLVKSLAKRIARETPSLADLAPEVLERLARVVMAERLKDELKREATLAGVDYPGERGRYLRQLRSAHTRRAYATALAALEAWTAARGLAPLELDPAGADDWIESLKAEGRSPASCRLAVAAASAFWTWLERRHRDLRNPFRGSRARPASRSTRALAVPTEPELRTLEAAAAQPLRAAIVLMAQGGLRVGALPSLSVHRDRYKAVSKGREITGRLPAEARAALELAGLPMRGPFADLTAVQIADAFRYLAGKLHRAGRLDARYSVHDLRHAFAVRFYEKSGHDLRATREALGHASVATTERYLRSLEVEEPNLTGRRRP